MARRKVRQPCHALLHVAVLEAAKCAYVLPPKLAERTRSARVVRTRADIDLRKGNARVCYEFGAERRAVVRHRGRVHAHRARAQRTSRNSLKRAASAKVHGQVGLLIGVGH